MRMDIDNIKKYKKMSVDDSNPWSDTYGMLYDAISTWGNPDYHGISHDDWWKSIKFDKNEKVTYNNNVEKKEENVSMFDASNMMNRYFGKIANGMIAAGTNVREQIVRPEFVTSVIGSDREDNMARLEL